jgi:hypothetical protein
MLLSHEESAARSVAAWRAAASAEGISANEIERTGVLLKDALEYIQLTTDEATLARFEASAQEFAATHRFAFDDPERAEGSRYWFVHCVAEAFQRPQLDADATAALHEHYRRRIQDITETLRGQWRAALGAEDAEFLDDADAAIDAARDRCLEWTGRLIEDFLCPAFKQPLSDKPAYPAATIFMRGMGPPKLGDASMFSMDRRELYRLRAEQSARDSVKGIMFGAFIHELRVRIPTPYWGSMTFDGSDMSWTAGRDRLHWPAYHQMRPNESLNKKYEWTRPPFRPKSNAPPPPGAKR